MIRMRKSWNRFLDTRSISFRLYLIIIPSTVLAILLITYVESRVAATVLENKVRNDTIMVAEQLAADLGRRPEPLSAEGMHPWLAELVEGNSYIRRIEVFHLIDGSISIVDTTSGSAAPSIIDVDHRDPARAATAQATVPGS